MVWSRPLDPPIPPPHFSTQAVWKMYSQQSRLSAGSHVFTYLSSTLHLVLCIGVRSDVDHKGPKMVYLGSCGSTNDFGEVQFWQTCLIFPGVCRENSHWCFVFLYIYATCKVYTWNTFLLHFSVDILVCLQRRVAGAVFARLVILCTGTGAIQMGVNCCKMGMQRGVKLGLHARLHMHRWTTFLCQGGFQWLFCNCCRWLAITMVLEWFCA